jgi:hypothetical protein
MIERIETVYQWMSPICLSIAGGMVYAGFGPLDAVVQDWTAAIFWGICGAFAASGLIFAVLALYAAQNHVRVARARILRHRRQLSLRNRTAGSYTHLLIP